MSVKGCATCVHVADTAADCKARGCEPFADGLPGWKHDRAFEDRLRDYAPKEPRCELTPDLIEACKSTADAIDAAFFATASEEAARAVAETVRTYPGQCSGADPYAAQRAEQEAAGRGLRFNAGKPRVDLLPPDAIMGLANLMTVNELKYPDRNWERGMPLSDVLASLERHTLALKAGEDVDPTDGQLHALKIMWNGMALACYHMRGIGTDDRVKVALPELKVPEQHG